jgi:NitT/TauT family transport system substrate-binding protein
MKRVKRATFLAAAAGGALLPEAARAQSASPLRVACVASGAYAEALYGLDGGFFRAAGLDVTPMILTSGAAIVEAVAGGTADIGISNPISLVNAVLHGIPFVYICCGSTNNSAVNDICVAAGGPIRSAKDLNGKTIAVAALKDVNTVALDAWLDQNGGDAKGVRLVELPFSEMGDALRRGTVDAAMIPEPALSAARRAGGIRALLPHVNEALGPHWMIGGWFVKADWLAANRPTARRFVDAIYRTAVWANVHVDETSVILAKYSQQDVAVVRTIARLPYGTVLTPDMIQPVLDAAAKYKVIERAPNAADLIARL